MLLSTLRVGALAALVAAPALAQDFRATTTTVLPYYTSQEAAQAVGLDGWQTAPVWTVGESIDGYVPPGIPDGLGAIQTGPFTARIFVNHELSESVGYPYTLANGTVLTGARVSAFDVNRKTRWLLGAGPAYHTIIDRYGVEVTSGTQIGGGSATDGLNRLCSAALFEAGEYGLVDPIFFTGEETDGGQEFILDVAGEVLYAAPWLGRAAWESITLLDTGDDDTVAVLVGDDRAGAPLLLYVGTKADGDFLSRNGLTDGALHVWVADSGETTPNEWNGTGSVRTGRFVAIDHYDPTMAGQPGYDAQGFADQDTQDALAEAAGAFRFSRPEDVATNPADGTQAVMASTGRGGLFPADNWGITYLIDVAFGAEVTATLTALYDGDDAGNGVFADPDLGLRSPDNLEWASDGLIYLQEDRSTSPGSLFGGVSGRDASIWVLDPATPTVFEDGDLVRILEVDMTAIPDGQRDAGPFDLGVRETSGIVDVSDVFLTRPGEKLFIIDVQAHEADAGPIADQGLVQGGQLLFLSKLDRPIRTFPFPGTRAEGAGDVLLAPSPNPVRGRATVSFDLAEAGDVTVAVYDALGREVSRLFDGAAEAGVQAVTFDAEGLPSGVYVIRMASERGSDVQRVTVVR